MSYASGGLIQATDYNNLAWGGSQGTYTASPNNVAYVMGVGSGAVGYGQDVSLVNTVSAAGTVTATQWAGLIHLTNKALGHQGQTQLNSGGNINAVSGGTITYFSNVSAAVTQINSTYASFGAQGSTTTGSNFSAAVAPGFTVVGDGYWGTRNVGNAYGEATIMTRYVNFASGDAARYFFNAGGQLNFIVSSVTNNNGTTRSSNFATLLTTYGQSVTAFRNTTNGGFTGSGGSSYSSNTSFGYRNLTTSWQNTHTVYGTGSYATDYAKWYFITNGTNQSGNGDFGSQIGWALNAYSPAHVFDNILDVTVYCRIDIVYPESTYLTTNSWGTPTIS